MNLQQFFLERHWRFCVIGGLALLRWGGPRFTRDIDVTLLTGFGSEEQFIQPILAAGYQGRIPDAAEFAKRNRVLLVSSSEGVPVDIVLAGLPFEETMVERSTLFEFDEGCLLRTCSAEDLVIQKLFAFRPRDIDDVETVVVKQRGRLDWDYIAAQLTPLAELKDQPEIVAMLAKLRHIRR